uniref:Uncharacterized protein n=1 Tax=Trichogramma kaykai TaxID=54128 RepID=A0ABD2WTU7_9HYME
MEYIFFLIIYLVLVITTAQIPQANLLNLLGIPTLSNLLGRQHRFDGNINFDLSGRNSFTGAQEFFGNFLSDCLKLIKADGKFLGNQIHESQGNIKGNFTYGTS